MCITMHYRKFLLIFFRKTDKNFPLFSQCKENFLCLVLFDFSSAIANIFPALHMLYSLSKPYKVKCLKFSTYKIQQSLVPHNGQSYIVKDRTFIRYDERLYEIQLQNRGARLSIKNSQYRSGFSLEHLTRIGKHQSPDRKMEKKKQYKNSVFQKVCISQHHFNPKLPLLKAKICKCSLFNLVQSEYDEEFDRNEIQKV